MSIITTTTQQSCLVNRSPICDPIPAYNLQKLSDERSKTLHSLLKQNHRDLALLLGPHLLLHSHMPHKLGSAYFLGFSPSKMTEMYHSEANTMKYEHANSGFVRTGITRDNWREFFNKKRYTVALTDFFDQEVSRNSGDWERVLNEYLFSSPQPLINGYVGGLGHPFIHLAYAYEFQNPEVAMEALSLGCTERDHIHRFLDTPGPDISIYKTTSLREILEKIHTDDRFSRLFDLPGYSNIYIIFGKAERAILEHWHAWNIGNPPQQLEELLDLAMSLLMGTSTENHEYDFYLAHTLTVGHAVRVLLPKFPEEQVIPILRQFGMFILYIYIAQLRPKIKNNPCLGIQVDEKDWEWVRNHALSGEFAFDSHRLKVLRALQVLEETWGKKKNRYLKAAIKFVSDFNGWTGFGKGVDGVVVDED